MELDTIGFLIVIAVASLILSAITGWNVVVSGIVFFVGLIGLGLILHNN